MRTIVLQEPGQFVCQEMDLRPPEPHEALVRIHRIGVCGTDWHAFAGRQPFFTYPRVLGHELGVEVIACPANARGIKPGDRCAVEPYLFCGQCRACQRGKTNCCEQLQTLGVHVDGGMRRLLALPLVTLYPSSRLSYDQLALVETLGIGAHAVERSQLAAGEQALVVGAGPIGLATTQFALAAGAQVRVVDVSPARRAFVGQLGVETLAEFSGPLADVVFDATGNRASMEASFQYVAHSGRLVFVGLVQGAIAFDDPQFHRREISLLASRNSAGLFPKIMGLIETGQIDTGPWITHRLDLARVPSALPALAGHPGLVKAMLETSPSDE